MLCVIHCFLSPIIIIAAPMFGGFLGNHYLELVTLGLSILFGVIIIYSGYCRHKKLHSLILFIIGGSIWTTHTLLEFFEFHSTETYLLIGALFVIVSYILNHRFLKYCPADSCN